MVQETEASLSKVEEGGYNVNQRCHCSALHFEAALKSHSKTMVWKASLFRERKVFLKLPRLEFSLHIRKSSSEKLSDRLVNRRGGENADMTKVEFLLYRKNSYFVTWGKK